MAYHVICSSYSRIHLLFLEPQYLLSSHSRLRSKAQTHCQLRPRSNPLNFSRHHLRLPGISKRSLILSLLEVKWSRSVVSDSLRPHGLQPTRLLHPWDSPGKSMEWIQSSYMQFICHSPVRAVPEVIKDLSVPKNNTLDHFSYSVFTCVLPEGPEVDLSLRTHS